MATPTQIFHVFNPVDFLVKNNNKDMMRDDTSLLPPPPPPPLDALQACEIEPCAQAIVGLMKDFIDRLRAIKEFNVVVPQLTVSGRRHTMVPSSEEPRTSCTASSPVATINLWLHVNDLVPQINKVCENVQEITTSLAALDDVVVVPFVSAEVEVEEEEVNKNCEEGSCDGRTCIVYRILLPIIHALTSCYVLLDRLPQEAPPSIPTKAAPSSSSSSSTTRSSKEQQPRHPAPPRGMLSLRQYTDAAAFLEFTACTSLLPLLDDHVMPIPSHRVTYDLSKTLRQRLPPASLLWGSDIVVAAATTRITTAASRIRRRNDNEKEEKELWKTVQTMGRLVLLDRFRPMLLPRHLIDLYAALLQVEELMRVSHPRQEVGGGGGAAVGSVVSNLRELWKEKCHGAGRQLLMVLLPEVCTDDNHARLINQDMSPQRLDATWQARAYQSLLGRGGKQAPAWLRRRLACALQTLATTQGQLEAVVRVYVHQASSQHPNNNDNTAAVHTETSAAALRLAHALTTTPSPSTTNKNTSKEERHNDQVALLQQAMVLLDQASHVQKRDEHSPASMMTKMDGWNLQFVWALFARLPPTMVSGILTRDFYPNNSISQGTKNGKALDNNSISLHRATRRLGVLLSQIPPAGTGELLGLWPRLLPVGVRCLGEDNVSMNENGQEYVLHVLVSVATASSILQSNLQQDATWVLQLIVEAVTESGAVLPPQKGSSKQRQDGVRLMATALIHAVAQTSSYQYGIDPSTVKPLEYDKCIVREVKEIVPNPTETARDMEVRARFVAKQLLAPLLPPVDETRRGNSGGVPDETNSTPLPKASALPSCVFQRLLTMYLDSQKQKSISEKEIGAFCMVPMVMLPVLCEECSVESLLFGPADSGVTDNSDDKADDAGNSLFNTMRIVFESAASRSSLRDDMFGDSEEPSEPSGGDTATTTSARFPADDNEMALSLASLLVTMLTAILELGASKRSSSEETLLQSLLPSLQTLASAHTSKRQESRLQDAEIADMASHAAALIASRQVKGSDANIQRADTNSTTATLLAAKFEQAKRDLASPEPPIRARGVVTLRHITSALREEVANAPAVSILVLSEDSKTEEHDGNVHLLEKILCLSINALADSESYVYLAAIQTITVLVDQRPSKFLPFVAMAVASGKMEGAIPEELSGAQRIKLAEALVCIVRRRAAITEYVPLLIDLLAYGTNEAPSQRPGLGEATQIMTTTHKYFLHGHHFKGDDLEPLNGGESLEERDLRIKTGGPLFDTEEPDVVRANLINVAAEVVFAAQPSVLAPYCFILVDCANLSLQVDASRSVRRAGALLAAAMYESLMQEWNEALEAAACRKPCSSPMALATVSADEETLAAALHRCVEGSDIADWSREKGRVFDPATVARCEEALACRNELELGGLFAAARVAASTSSREESIGRLLREGKKEQDIAVGLTEVARRKIEEL